MSNRLILIISGRKLLGGHSFSSKANYGTRTFQPIPDGMELNGVDNYYVLWTWINHKSA